MSVDETLRALRETPSPRQCSICHMWVDRRTHEHRCCICRDISDLEYSDLIDTGYRCTDRTACRQRVRGIVAANVGLGEMCE